MYLYEWNEINGKERKMAKEKNGYAL